MKLSNKPCPVPSRLRRERLSLTCQSLGRFYRVLTGLVALVLSSGCALSGQYRDAVAASEKLRDANAMQSVRVEQLEASVASLEAELASIYETVEDERIESEILNREVQDLEEAERSLSLELEAQNLELVRSRSELESVKSEVDAITATYGELMLELESEVSSGQIRIDQLKEGVRVAVSDDILFASGSARLDPTGREVILKLSEQLATMEHQIEVQGHTDDRAISDRLAGRFPSNWDLAAARAAAVIRLLEKDGISPQRLSLTSLSSSRPVATNETVDGRALNRRIEIRLRPQDKETVSEDVFSSQTDALEP